MTSEYDEGNRLVKMGEVEFEYDGSGNQLGVESDGDSVFLSTFMNGEKWNLRTEVLPDIAAGVPWASYSYSLDGRRVGKEIAWTVEPEPGDFQRVYYLYVDMDAEHPLEFRNEFRINGQNVVYEFGENHPTVRYTHPLVCDGGVCGPTASMFVDAPISIVVNGVKYYYLYDGLGSVTELIDEDENVVNVYRYTPFGESIVKIEGVFNPYQYTGRRFDNETGQYYYRARMYSSVQGRFLSQDPLGMVDGPNMYMYCGNDPVNVRDPTGMFRWRVLRRWRIPYGYEADFTYSESVRAAFSIRITIPLCLKTPMPTVCIAICSSYYAVFWYCSFIENKGTRIGWTILGGILYPPKCISYY